MVCLHMFVHAYLKTDINLNHTHTCERKWLISELFVSETLKIDVINVKRKRFCGKRKRVIFEAKKRERVLDKAYFNDLKPFLTLPLN